MGSKDWWSSFSSYFPPLFLSSLPLCEVWVQYSHIWYWSFLWELGTFGSVLWIISQHLWEIVCCGLWASTFEKFTVGTKSLLNRSVIIQGLLATTFENCVVKIMSWLASTFESKTVGWLLEIRWPYNKSIRVPWHMDWCLCSAWWELITNVTPSTKQVVTRVSSTTRVLI